MSLINTIACGDCREILPTLPAKSFQLAFADPPYWVGFDYGNLKDTEMAYVDPTWLVTELLRVAECVLVTPGIQNHHDYPKPDWMIAWVKQPFANARSNMGGFNVWEPINFYGKPPSRISFDKVVAPGFKDKESLFHACPKPVKLLNWIISNFSKEGDNVIDPFSGSGTTCKSAFQLGRNYLGIEIDPKIVELSLARLHNSQPPLLGMAQANTASSRLFEGWGELPAVANQSEGESPA